MSESGNITVVGIGASAGGLAALKAFFAHVPSDSGLAYVVVVHLSPDHESHLADLLQLHVKMPVRQVTETLLLEANQVYVIPPGFNLDSVDTRLHLSKLEEQRHARAPINHFFRTLAGTHDGQSVGVILSGTGSDGTLGIQKIKAQGGLVVVQDPVEAEYDGMPRSAIGTGLADLVLPVSEMPAHILRFAHTKPQIALPEAGEEVGKDEQQLLHKVFVRLLDHTGRDFSRYKRSTILRRLQRRMQLNHTEELEDYLVLLLRKPEEVQSLADDMLITVTSFFRDPEVFEKLAKQVIPELFKHKKTEDSIRIWSVGCATGEEAYSLAMLLLEEAGKRSDPSLADGDEQHEASPRLQIFASDLHEHSLQKAREGYYPTEIETDVSAERLQRFFVRENGAYRIRKEVRDLVVFASHNLMSDPPFSRIDLISCRNLLIYLQRELQQDIIKLFHYGLNAGGYLLLGPSETLENSELFRPVNKKQCLYRKRNVSTPEQHLAVFSHTRPRPLGELREARPEEAPLAYGVLHQQMVERFAPPSLLVGPNYQMVHLSEHAGHYLVNPGGEPTFSVFKRVRPEFQLELRTAFHAAQEKKMVVHSKPVPVSIEGVEKRVVLSVYPGREPEQEEFFLVIFEEWPGPESSLGADKAAGEVTASDTTTIRELRTELELIKQRLQTIIGEYETSQEEMRASNEEMQSANEELRSTMEELETSKEELQSVNEELATINQENRHKVEELAQLSADLQNLLTATDIATLFLDRQLRIVRFTPQVGKLFNVRLADRGRPLSDFTHRLGYKELQSDARQVLDTLVPVELEVQDEQGQWYFTRVLPYRSSEDRIEGIVITFVDITSRKQMEGELREAKEYAEHIVDTLHEPLLVLSPDLRVKSGNQAFYEHFRVRKEDTKGRLIYELGNGQWNIPALRTLLEEVLPKNNVFNDYEVSHNFPDIGQRVMLLNGCRLDDVQLILLGIRDITEHTRAEEALRASEERYRTLFTAIDEAFALCEIVVDETGKPVDYRMMEVNPAYEVMTGFTPEAAREKTARELIPGLENWWIETYGKVALQNESIRFENYIGELDRWYDVYAFPRGEGRFAILFNDISEKKKAEKALQQEKETAQRYLDTAASIFLVLDKEGKVVMLNRQGSQILGYAEEEVVGKNWFDHFLPEQEKERVRQAIDKLLLGKLDRVEHFENPVLTKKQEERLIEWHNATIYDEQGQPAAVLSSGIDITEKKKAERDIMKALIEGQEVERERIARELHEGLGQSFTAMQLNLNALQAHCEHHGPEAKKLYEQLRTILYHTTRDMKAISRNLMPSVLKTYGLVEGLKYLCQNLSPVPVQLQVYRMPEKLDSFLSMGLFRIAQELINNALKHGKVAEIRVQLIGHKNSVVLMVEDDGIGFDQAAMHAGNGFGLKNMEARVKTLNGAWEIDASPGKGTLVTVEIPL